MRIDRILVHLNALIEHVYQASGPDGDTTPTDVPVRRCYISEKTRIVRNRDGVDTLSSTTVIVPLDKWCEPGSQVTLWPDTPKERRTTVINAARGTFNSSTPNHAALYCE